VGVGDMRRGFAEGNFPKAFFPGFLEKSWQKVPRFARLGKKGFLGPIGDDLPSLIPLLFALMLFFYVFTFTWNAFDQKGQLFDDALAAMRVGNTLKGNNYMRNYEAFDQRCREAHSVKRVKFLAGLIPLKTGPGQEFSGVDVEELREDFQELEGNKFECSNVDLKEDSPSLQSDSLVIRSFPVALEFKNPDPKKNTFYVRPMLLVVVTWR